jgi:hypothetical protein
VVVHNDLVICGLVGCLAVVLFPLLDVLIGGPGRQQTDMVAYHTYPDLPWAVRRNLAP